MPVVQAAVLLAKRIVEQTSGLLRSPPPSPDGRDGVGAGPSPLEIPDVDEAERVLLSILNRISVTMLNVTIPSTHPIEYYSIHASDVLTVGVFVLQKGATMPIHDHPHMTVYSKIVSGDLHVKTYELLPSPASDRRPARVHMDRTVQAADADSLLTIRPDRGPTLHALTAASDHVVLLDVLGPPYDDERGRPCTYYEEGEPGIEDRVAGLSLGGGAPDAWLVEAPHPEVDPEPRHYAGLKVDVGRADGVAGPEIVRFASGVAAALEKAEERGKAAAATKSD